MTVNELDLPGSFKKKATVILTRELTVEGAYLNIPIKPGAPRRTMRLTVEGKVVRAFEVELARKGDIGCWMFTDISPWRGQKLTLSLDIQSVEPEEKIRRESLAHPLAADDLEIVEVGDAIRDADELYREALRPQFHFSARRGYINDPNGLYYHAGEYHLFYQHDPFSLRSSKDKAWGHAVSRDLVHWQELPVALHADEEGAKWSGSGLVDAHNTSGLQQGDEPPALIFYTATAYSAMNPDPQALVDHPFVQSMAISHDRGRTWRAYPGNPLIPNITPANRDPLVFRHEPSGRWVMLLFVGQPRSGLGNRYETRIFSSADLKDWRHESTVEGFFDCPVLYELPLLHAPGETRWVMHCVDMKYKVGRFDGKTFTPETGLITGQRGDCAYAAQMFNHAPDNRRIQISWGRVEAPDMPFSQMMCFPCDLALVATDDGPRICWTPVPEIERLHTRTVELENQTLPAGVSLRCGRGRHLDLSLVVAVGTAQTLTLKVGGIELVVSVADKQLRVQKHTAPVRLAGGRLQLRLLVDRISLEIFGDGGLLYMPLAVTPAADCDITLQADGGGAVLEKLACHELASIWTQP